MPDPRKPESTVTGTSDDGTEEEEEFAATAESEAKVRFLDRDELAAGETG